MSPFDVQRELRLQLHYIRVMQTLIVGIALLILFTVRQVVTAPNWGPWVAMTLMCLAIMVMALLDLKAMRRTLRETRRLFGLVRHP